MCLQVLLMKNTWPLISATQFYMKCYLHDAAMSFKHQISHHYVRFFLKCFIVTILTKVNLTIAILLKRLSNTYEFIFRLNSYNQQCKNCNFIVCKLYHTIWQLLLYANTNIYIHTYACSNWKDCCWYQIWVCNVWLMVLGS